ncbi:MAG: sugar ABC transporter substrate-binding protein [Desulfopila sp.]
MKKLLVAVVMAMMMTSVAYGKKITIGYTFHSAQDVYQNLLKDEFVAAAEEKDIEVRVIDPLMDIERQAAAIENFITLGVDAIVCSPLDYEGAIPGVLAANQAGIPYVALNAEIGGDGDFVYVGSLNYDAGLIEGEYMAKVLPQGAQIVYLRGTEGMEHTIARRKGVQDALLDKRPDVKLLAEQTAKYDRAEGMRVMEDWIQTYPEIDGVLSANDQMSLGALEALKGAGIGGVLIAGIDGTLEGRQCVKEGTFAITVLQDAKGQAGVALQAALDLVEGKQVEKRIIVPFRPITKENVDEYLD